MEIFYILRDQESQGCENCVPIAIQFDLYQKCSKEIRADQDISLLHSIETKLFPYINFTALNSEQSHNFWPVHTRFDGTKYRGQVLQFSSENNSFIGTSPIEFKASEPFGRTG